MSEILFFIPARGGSKGLPGKNIKLLGEKPLIAWTIEAAKNCGFAGRVVVSTDDNKIADIAKQYGAEVPWLRPAELAKDDTPTLDVLYDFLEKESQKNYKPAIIVLLQPTSPFRSAEQIHEVLTQLVNDNWQSIVSVCNTEHHPLWSNVLPGDLSMADFIRPNLFGKNRQQLPVYYRINGSIYAFYTEYLFKNKSFYGNKSKAYIMNADDSVDIDTLRDFQLAEIILNEKSNR